MRQQREKPKEIRKKISRCTRKYNKDRNRKRTKFYVEKKDAGINEMKIRRKTTEHAHRTDRRTNRSLNPPPPLCKKCIDDKVETNQDAVANSKLSQQIHSEKATKSVHPKNSFLNFKSFSNKKSKSSSLPESIRKSEQRSKNRHTSTGLWKAGFTISGTF